MSLSENQKKYLRGLAHTRHALVQIGKEGLTPAVAQEMDSALASHELVKVRARVGDREERDQIFDRLTGATSSILIQRIGNVGVFFRQRKEKSRITLPSA